MPRDEYIVDGTPVQDTNNQGIVTGRVAAPNDDTPTETVVPVQHFGVAEAVRELASINCSDDMRSFIVTAKLLHPYSNRVPARISFFSGSVIPEHRWHPVQIVAALDLIINKYSETALEELTGSESKREKLVSCRALRNQINLISLEGNRSVTPRPHELLAYHDFLEGLIKLQKTLGELIAGKAEDLGRGRLKAALQALSKQLDQSTVNVEKLVAKAIGDQQTVTPAPAARS